MSNLCLLNETLCVCVCVCLYNNMYLILCLFVHSQVGDTLVGDVCVQEGGAKGMYYSA